MMQNHLFQSARFLRGSLIHCLPSLKLDLFIYYRRKWYTLEDISLEEITSGLIQTNLLRLDPSGSALRRVQAEITDPPAVVRIGPNQWSWAMSVIRYAMGSESR